LALLAGISSSKDCIFNVSELEDAVSRLTTHTNEGNSELATDCFINGGRDFLSLVAFFLTAITVHGNVPESFRRCIIVPIPKGHNVNQIVLALRDSL